MKETEDSFKSIQTLYPYGIHTNSCNVLYNRGFPVGVSRLILERALLFQVVSSGEWLATAISPVFFIQQSIPKTQTSADVTRAQYLIIRPARQVTQLFLFVVPWGETQMAAAGLSLVTRRISSQVFRTCSRINVHQARSAAPLYELSRRAFSVSLQRSHERWDIHFNNIFRNNAR